MEGERELLRAITDAPDPDKAKDRDVARVAHVRLVWTENGWLFDSIVGISTYYEQLEVSAAK